MDKSFIDWLKDNEPIKYAYKERHRKKFVWYDWKDYIIEENKEWNRKKLTLYSKWLVWYKIIPMLEKDWWTLICQNDYDVLIQCKKYFEYDVSFDFQKLDLDNLQI